MSKRKPAAKKLPKVKKLVPDVFWDGPHRADAETDPDFPILRVRSNDVGTANWGMGQFALVTVPGTRGEETITYAEHNAVLTFKNRSPYKTSVEDLTRNMFTKMSMPRVAWHWKGTCPIICESQVDQLPTHTKGGYGAAINYATYTAFHMYCMARLKPLLCLEIGSEAEECVSVEEISENLGRKDPFTGVSARAKRGMEDLHGTARKVQSGPRGMDYYRKTGQLEILEWMGTLATQKPQEDAGDILHQARWFLEEQHKERLKIWKKAHPAPKKSKTPRKKGVKRKRALSASDAESRKRATTQSAPESCIEISSDA